MARREPALLQFRPSSRKIEPESGGGRGRGEAGRGRALGTREGRKLNPPFPKPHAAYRSQCSRHATGPPATTPPPPRGSITGGSQLVLQIHAIFHAWREDAWFPRQWSCHRHSTRSAAKGSGDRRKPKIECSSIKPHTSTAAPCAHVGVLTRPRVAIGFLDAAYSVRTRSGVVTPHRVETYSPAPA